MVQIQSITSLQDKYPARFYPCVQPAPISNIGEWCRRVPHSPSVPP